MKFLTEFYMTLEKSVRAPYANQNQKSSFFFILCHIDERGIFLGTMRRTGGEE